MFKIYLFSLLLLSGSLQGGPTSVLLKNLGSSSKVGELGKSHRELRGLMGSLSRSNRSSMSASESSFLQNTGYLMNEAVPLADVEAVLDKQLEVVGKFKRQGSFKKTLEALLTQPLFELVEFEQINSIENLLEKIDSRVHELLNKDKTKDEIEKNIKVFFVDALKMIRTFVFCKPEESKSITNDISKSVNEKAKKVFLLFNEHSEELLKLFNDRMNLLPEEVKAIEAKVKASLDFFSVNAGANGAEMILREVEQIFYYPQSPEAEFQTFTHAVFERIAEAAFVADWAMVSLNSEASVGRLYYFGELVSVLCEEIRFTLSDEAHSKEAVTFLSELAQTMVHYAQEAPSEPSQEGEVVFVDILHTLMIDIFTKAAKESIPFSDEDHSYLAFVETLKEKELFTQETVEWSDPKWNPSFFQCMAFLQLIHANFLDAQNANEKLVFAMFRNMDKLFSLTKDKSLILGQALFGLNKFSYFFDPSFSIEDIDFENVEKMTKLNQEAKADIRLINLMDRIIMDTLFYANISPEDFGIEIDRTIDASSYSDDDKYFTKVLNGLTILRHTHNSDYLVNFSNLKPSEEIKKQMKANWIFRDAYKSLMKTAPQSIGISQWKEQLQGLSFETDEVETERLEREKNKLKDLKVQFDINGHVENIKLDNHEVEQVTKTLDADCEVEVVIKKVLVAENITFLPSKFFYRNQEVTEEQLDQLRRDCIKTKQVERNIIDVINGSLPENMIEKLEESDDIIEYIQKNGVIKVQTPEGIHEYVFVKRTSHENPCFEEEEE